jgi:hypothetical protein
MRRSCLWLLLIIIAVPLVALIGWLLLAFLRGFLFGVA